MSCCACPPRLSKVTSHNIFIWDVKLINYLVWPGIIFHSVVLLLVVLLPSYFLSRFHFITIKLLDINKYTSTVSGYLNDNFVVTICLN